MITSLINNQFESDSSSMVFIGISISVYLIFAVDHLIQPIICVKYSQTFASAFVYMINKLNVKVLKKLMSLLVGIKFDNQSGKLFHQTAESAFALTAPDGIVTKRRPFQHGSRAVVKHNLNPENQNELLNVIWESAKMNPRCKR
uniref:Uncharacterized protein n=1 Tax=Romanomermis culicivorax TaxID=13658 RepID=A0A915I1U6_ROMCU